MKTFATLPAEVRRILARRELRRRGAGIDADHPQHAAAIGGLFMALRAAFGDPISLSECVRELAQRIEVRDETAQDFEVLATLPLKHLATLAMAPAEFITLLAKVEDSA